MGLGKKIFIVILTLLSVLCIGIDIWCLVVYKYGEEKIVSNTINMDIMETVDGTDKKTFLEINYYKNKDNSGLELFEIKYNEFQDENLTNFVSVGSQYVANSINQDISFTLNTSSKSSAVPVAKKTLKTTKFGFFDLWSVTEHNWFYQAKLEDGASYYEYQSADDYEFSIGNDINCINSNTKFKVTIGEDIYLVGLKNAKVSEFYYGSLTKDEGSMTSDIYYKYAYLDNNFLAYSLYNMCKNSTSTSGSYELIQITDIFEYKKWDGKTYQAIEETNNEKVKTEFNNNYIIKINIHDEGATNATQSMFNQIQGDSQFNLTGGYVSEDYFYGLNVINVGLGDFDLILYRDDIYLLKLKDEFIETYFDYRKAVVLDVQVNLDLMTSEGLLFGGFVSDCFDDFSVYECSTIETVDGVIQEKGVQYA